MSAEKKRDGVKRRVMSALFGLNEVEHRSTERDMSRERGSESQRRISASRCVPCAVMIAGVVFTAFHGCCCLLMSTIALFRIARGAISLRYFFLLLSFKKSRLLLCA